MSILNKVNMAYSNYTSKESDDNWSLLSPWQPNITFLLYYVHVISGLVAVMIL